VDGPQAADHPVAAGQVPADRGDRHPGGDLGVDADLDEQRGVVTEVGAPVDDGEPGAVGVTRSVRCPVMA